MMSAEEVLRQLTLEEKVTLLTGAGGMESAGVERLGIQGKKMADGPHGVRSDIENNCTQFPNLCSLAATWDAEAAEKMGRLCLTSAVIRRWICCWQENLPPVILAVFRQAARQPA